MSLPASIRLNRDFDPKKLQADLEAAQSQFRSAPQAGGYHDGSWTGIALKAINGDFKNTMAMSFTNVDYTEVMDHCPYFKEILDSMPFPVGVTRILFLPPGKKIGKHTDRGFSWENGHVRLHIPIVTSQKVQFNIGEESVHWPAGQFWFGDFNQPHWLDNQSDIVRVHIVMDCFVTTELLSLFPETALEQIRQSTEIKTFDHWETGNTITEPQKYTGYFKAPKTLSVIPLYGAITATSTTLEVTLFGLPFSYRYRPLGDGRFQALNGEIQFQHKGEHTHFTLKMHNNSEHQGQVLPALSVTARAYSFLQSGLMKGVLGLAQGFLKLNQLMKRVSKTT